jgi:hypothetical protein
MFAGASPGDMFECDTVWVQSVFDRGVPRPLTVNVDSPADLPPAPFTDTVYVPDGSPAGTNALMLVSDQLSILALAPPKYTVPSP